MGYYVNVYIRTHTRKEKRYTPRPWERDDLVLFICECMDIFGHPLFEDYYMAKLNFKDMIPSGKEKPGKPAAHDAEFEASYEGLMFFLTATADDDGRARATAMLITLAESGRWKLGLKDRQSNKSVWRSGETMQEALTSLNAALLDGTADWRTGSDK